jgi:hypothetical protein
MVTRPKIMIAVSALALLLLTVLLHGQPNAPAAPAPAVAGRYSVVGVPFTVNLSEGRTSVEQGVFKIDTATGQTWRHSTGVTKDGQFFERWVPIQN